MGRGSTGSCALVSRGFVARVQAHLFGHIRLWELQDTAMYARKATMGESVGVIQMYVLPDSGILTC